MKNLTETVERNLRLDGAPTTEDMRAQEKASPALLRAEALSALLCVMAGVWAAYYFAGTWLATLGGIAIGRGLTVLWMLGFGKLPKRPFAGLEQAISAE